MQRSLITISLIAIALGGCASRPDCQPISAFESGRSGQAMETHCESAGYSDAWRLGQTLGALESELQALNQATELTGAQRQRVRVLQREIPELETLARLEGWLPDSHLSSGDR